MTDKDFYLTKEKAQKLAGDMIDMSAKAVKASRADETDICINAMDSALTRFANNQIHQNNFERNAQVTVRAAVGKRVAKVNSNLVTPEGLAKAVEDAYTLAQFSPEDEDWAGLPQGPFEYPIKVDFFENTAVLTPEGRAKPLKQAFDLAGGTYQAAGTLSNTVVTLGVVNSHGVKAVCNATQGKFTVLYTGPDSSGYYEDTQRDFSAVDIMGAARRAMEKAEASRNPSAEAGVGKYTVILEEEAVATLMIFLSWLGFSAKMVHDKESFLTGKMGQKITGDTVTIYDDAGDPRTMGLPFDFEGVPKQKLGLIENGVAKAYAHSWKTAAKEGAKSTGHYIGWEEPLPVNLVLAGGDQTREELIASVDRGVLVSRFHYSNVVNPIETVITGMTRDGTFLIEGGKITRGLKNFRYTQNILAALANNEGMTRAQRFNSSFFGGGAVVPVVKIRDFNFSGKTDF